MPTILTEKQAEPGLRLTELVGVRQRFLRSVNLERDFYSVDALQGYVPTPAALSALERIAEGIRNPNARAYSLTGAYGTGKSAFALFAAKTLAVGKIGDANLRREARPQSAALNTTLFAKKEAGFWPVLVTGTREPLALALVRGLIQSLDYLPADAKEVVIQAIREELASVSASGSGSSSEPRAKDVVRLFEIASKNVRAHVAGCAGLLVVVDEMGKFLEYAALHTEQSDTQVLQELAECASRSGDNAIVFVTILHQAFEEYAYRLSGPQRNEWHKVQGRFADIPFGDGPEAILRLLAQAIQPQPTPETKNLLENVAEQNLATCTQLHIVPKSLPSADFGEMLRQVYPMHPLTFLIMPTLFQRFGQNERSLFSFLASDEPFGFKEFLDAHVLDGKNLPQIRVDHLYDYVVATLGSALYSHATAKLWSETQEALYRLSNTSSLQSRLVKTIGLLHILGEQTRILPSKKMLEFALIEPGITATQISEAIDALETATLITYRRFKKAYRLYEGSDVDIDARLRDAKPHFFQGTDVVATARRLETMLPVVARRHSYLTGTLRFFDVRYCRADEIEAEVRVGHADADGLMLLCLAMHQADFREAEATAQRLSLEHPDIIIGINVESDALRETAVAVSSLEMVQKDTPELEKDRVAQREVSERLLDATEAFKSEWNRLMHPQRDMADSSVWYYNGEVAPLSSNRQLVELVSTACDTAYPQTPKLLNELINRRQISSTSAAARRILIEAMILRYEQKQLGIDGFPPEMSMYVSILESTGIHRSVNGETWGIFPPYHENDPALVQVWKAIDDFLFEGALEARPLTQLYDILQARPFGLAEQVIPVLLCAVLLYNTNEVVVYEEGRFVVELDAATFERLIKRREDFTLQGCRIAGERQTVLDRFARGLLKSGDEITLVNVVRQLYRVVNKLPDYTLHTRKLEPSAKAVRDLLREGKEPEKLLFSFLPRLLGARAFTAQAEDPENVEQFFMDWNTSLSEVMGAYDALLSRIERALTNGFGTKDWEELRARSASILSHVTEPRLKSFVVRAGDEAYKRKEWLELVAGGISTRPPDVWSDTEEERFVNRLPPLISAFQHAEVIQFERQRRSNSDEQTGLRLAVTTDTGAEESRIVFVQKMDTEKIDSLCRKLLNDFEYTLRGEPEEVRLAVVSQLVQNLLKGQPHD